MVEITFTWTYFQFCKTNKLRNIYVRSISIQKWEIHYFKIKIIMFIIILDETLLLFMDKSKSKKGVSVSIFRFYSTEIMWDISDLQVLFVRNTDYQYLDILK